VKSCLRYAQIFVTVAQHLGDFGRFEKNKRERSRPGGRQREDRILVTRRHSSRNSRASFPAVILINVWVGIVENHLVSWIPMFYLRLIMFKTQEIHENRGILNRVGLSWTCCTEACIANDARHFEQLLWCFILYFYSQLQFIL
jgi:hypothetical protein